MDILKSYSEILNHYPGYERRRSQETMVRLISEAFAERKSLIVEAGTGSGKSFGYLIPALLQEKRPIVISTGTIALQEQLMEKDIPFLQQVPGFENIKARLVKGRGNYLCIQKLEELEREIQQDPAARLTIEALRAELAKGWSGDIADLDFSVPRELWADVGSDSDDCLGRKCRFFDQNPYQLAREDLDQCDILVTNHALYFQDIGVDRALLPDHDIVIFDEAHKLKETAMNSFTSKIGRFATTKLIRKISRQLKRVPDEYVAELIQHEANILTWLLQRDNTPDQSRTTFRLVPDEKFFSIIGQYTMVLEALYAWLDGLKVQQLTLLETDLDRDKAKVQRGKLIRQLKGLMGRWEHFLLEDPFAHDRLNWAELDKDRLYFELRSTPLNVSEMLQKAMWCDKTAVLTSATLSVNGSLAFTKSDLGLEGADEAILPSPFDYKTQCALYLPKQMPEPNSREFCMHLAMETERILHLTQGRAFLLFTSYRNMLQVADMLIPRLPFPCRMQGEFPRNKLIDWFKETPNSVLFATATFWEGIDIPGESLSCIVMDKIPFAPPDDPLNQAMSDYLTRQNKDWFKGYVLPNATIRIKQGFGRLIRSQADRGLVAILDPRLRSKGYGRTILNSLPNAKVLDSLDSFSLEHFSLDHFSPEPEQVLSEIPF